jgi:hypothetical protein
MIDEQAKNWIEATRAACHKAAREAFEEALMLGLCQEGAIEAALGAIETVEVSTPESVSKME